jgi:hypothetical protein
MLGTVTIPCFDRPAFLKICIEHILRADKADEFQFIFCLDYGFDVRNMDIIKEFPLRKATNFIEYKVMGWGKQSNNVLTGLCKAANLGLPIYYIEDDIMIGKDFFTFGSELIQQEPGILAAILSKNNWGDRNKCDDVNGYSIIDQTNNFQCLGTIYNPDMFLKWVAPHHIPEYIYRQPQYVKDNFPGSPLDLNYVEQDGLIRRIVEKNNLKLAYSCVPRCFHAGFYGYNRTQLRHVKGMTFDRQVELIRRVAFNPTELRKLVKNEEFVRDSLPVDLNTEHSCVKKITV